MAKIESYAAWEKRILESHTPEQINELFGLGKLLKSFFSSLSAPMKKNVELLTRNIDDKTGKVKDSKELGNDLVNTFKKIADDKKADLKDVDDVKMLKTVLKEFITDVRAVFVASRVPFTAMLESEDTEEVEILNEDLKTDFNEVMTNQKPEDFDGMLDMFLDGWIEKNGKTDLKALEKNATNFITNSMDKFSKKIKGFGPERLQKLVKLSTENTTPKKDEIKAILSDKTENATDKGEVVQTPQGKEQFIKAIDDLGKDAEIHKMKNKDGSYDVLIKDVELD